MEAVVRDDLLALFRTLRQEKEASNVDAFTECFKVFRRQKSDVKCSDEISNISRIKRMIPQTTIAEAMESENNIKRMDELLRNIQAAHTLSKTPELLEFFRAMAGPSYSEMGDGLWQSVDRAGQTPTPESGFATTPSDGYLPQFNGAGNRFAEYHNNGYSASLSHRSALPEPLTTSVRKPPSSLPLSSQNRCKTTNIPAFPILGHSSLTESQIIRDLLCVAEGFNGSKVVELTSDGCRLARDVQVNEEWRQVILSIAMTGWLHLQLKKYTESHKFEIYPYSLCAAALGSVALEELRSCRRVITALDAKVS